MVSRQTLALSLRSSQPARLQGTQAGVPCSTVTGPARCTRAWLRYGTASVGFGGQGPN